MNLTKNEQILAVERVLNEMKYAEDFLKKLNLSWTETLYDTKSDNLYNLSLMDLDLLQKKYQNYYNLVDLSDTDSDTIPLKRVELIDDYYQKKFIFKFNGISWNEINSKKTNSNIDFHNNGSIIYERKNSKLNRKTNKDVSYNLSYNVLSDDYTLEYSKNFNNKFLNDITLCKHNSKLLKRINNIEIIEDIENKEKKINIKGNRKRGRYNISIDYSSELNSDNSLNKSNLYITSFKNNQEFVKYSFSIDENKFIAKHIDENGNVTDITKNPRLLDMVINFIVGGTEELSFEFKVIKEYLDNYLKVAKEYIYKKDITNKEFKYSFDTIEEVDKKIVDSIKNIIGEIPLKGFKERFNNSLNRVSKIKKIDRV